MKHSFLKGTRVFLALLFFIPIVLFFCDFADILPDQLDFLMKIQVIPAILAGSLGALIVLTGLVLLFGRIYCSTICPLGVLQDFISRFSGRGKQKNKRKRWYQYSKPNDYLRYSLLCICTIFLIFGIITPILLLDPYSNFGRIATNLFRPLVMWSNNLINWIATKSGSFNFYHVSIYTITSLSAIGASVALLTVGIMSFLRGRLFCNTICPVGSLLGLVSRFSAFRIVMDDHKCNSCGACARACKSQCISSKQISIDHSRCVSCYNCLSRCKQDAIAYRFSWKRKAQSAIEINLAKQSHLSSGQPKAKFSRRSFIATGTALAATLPVIPAWAQQADKDLTKLTPITPPGSKSLKHFKEKCTACHLCITHCPQQILKPAGFTFGLNYAFKPHMVYETAYCNFECTICSQICPNNAIYNLSIEEKKTTQVGIAQFEKSRCVVHTEGTDCGACSEHCPTQAVKMMPYKDGLRLPEVTPDLCIGCGGCEYICPVRPVKAINVLANEVHQASRKPEEEEIKHFKVDDFGF